MTIPEAAISPHVQPLLPGGYWRLDTLYDDQLGVGVLGDQSHAFKFQYVGAVYRDLETGHNEYLGQGTGVDLHP